MKICPRGKGGHGVSVGLHMKLTIDIENTSEWGHNLSIMLIGVAQPVYIELSPSDLKAST